MIVRQVEPKDAVQWLKMRGDLWPEDHETEVRAYFAGLWSRQIVFVAEAGQGELTGFVEVSIRHYAEGCDSDHVGYIEGWYVLEPYRRQNVGRALVEAAEDWARAQGCTEMASDCLIDNDVSLAAHLALDYEEVERVICFRKSL
jgi:aminoglycoside 6'-N-acetyltransferase I